MKKAISIFSALSVFLIIPIFFVSAYVSPGRPIGHVNDFAGILTTEQKSALENRIGNYARPAGAQIAVVTVTSLGDETIETYAVKLFEEWGIGDKLADNGVLLLVAPNERTVRIEVGYGLEGSVTDAASSVIVRDKIIPAFKSGDYYGGIDAAMTDIMGLIDRDPTTMQTIAESSRGKTSANAGDIAYLFVFGGFVLFRILARTKSWWLGGVIGAIVGFLFFHSFIGTLATLVVGLALDFVLSKYLAGKPGGGGPFIFFGSGGRGGGGGFGGFGGGMSGSGGSSGRW